MDLTPHEAAREIAKCAKSFPYFCTEYLWVLDKEGNKVRFRPNRAQQRYLEAIGRGRRVMILKARQLGLTTIIAARAMWQAMFRPGFKVLVVAHKQAAAEKIFREKYRYFYDNLPKFLQFGTAKDNTTEMVFKHGGSILVTNAGSDDARGGTAQFLHASEFAFWPNVQDAMSNVGAVIGKREFVIETTANGINDFHKMWADGGKAWQRLFINWLDDEHYVTSERYDVPDELRNYQKVYGLTDDQFHWAIETFQVESANNINLFNQEYPLTADLAFIASGTPFFPFAYPGVEFVEGLVRYNRPEPYRIYSMGVDTASGSPTGDYSAFNIEDVTDPRNTFTVCSFYGRLDAYEFAELALEEAKRYGAMAVIEENYTGQVVVNHFIRNAYGNLYMRQVFDDASREYSSKAGWHTSKATRDVLLANLLRAVSRGYTAVNDPRFQHEVNTFRYIDGVPDHEPGKHSDMIFAKGLSLMATDQLGILVDEVLKRKPSSLREQIAFEALHDEWVPDDLRNDEFEWAPSAY